jgi:hypothetical protein
MSAVGRFESKSRAARRRKSMTHEIHQNVSELRLGVEGMVFNSLSLGVRKRAQG